MNAPVVTLHPGGVVTREQIDAVKVFEAEMQAATCARECGFSELITLGDWGAPNGDSAND